MNDTVRRAIEACDELIAYEQSDLRFTSCYELLSITPSVYAAAVILSAET